MKRRNNFITNLICDYTVITLQKRLRNATPKHKKRIKKFFRPVFQQRLKKKAAYQININAVDRRIRPNSKRGILLRMRRQISLFYGGGRIRAKTFRRYSRLIAERNKPVPMLVGSSRFQSYQHRKTFAERFESRLDVLLLRTNFVNSIYKARHLIFHRKYKVSGFSKISNPGVQLRIYQKFTPSKRDAKLTRQNLYKRIKKYKSFILSPTYLFVDYILMQAFLIENPITHLVGFTFSENLGALANFRKSFRML